MRSSIADNDIALWDRDTGQVDTLGVATRVPVSMVWTHDHQLILLALSHWWVIDLPC